MDLPSTFAARRLSYLAGRPFWVRPLDLAGWSEVLAWLDDVLPGRPERAGPPRLADDASQLELRTPPGRALLAWIGLRDQGVGYEEAAALWASAGEDERYRLVDVLTARRRTLDRDAPGGTDLAETWCGEGLASLAAQLGLDAVGRLTLDQAEWLMSAGDCDRAASPSAQTAARVQREWEEMMRRKKEAEAAEAPAPADPGVPADE